MRELPVSFAAVLILGLLIALMWFVADYGCRGTRPPRQLSWFQLIDYGQLVVSKKSRTRGDVDHNGRTRRQRAHRPS